MVRIGAIVSLLLIGLMSWVPAATAGGWATVELSGELPKLVVGQAVTIEYQVLQHGRAETPLVDMVTDFVFLHEESGFFVAVRGEATGDPDVYSITFTLDQPGTWEMRSMMRTFGAPTLTTHPEVTASANT